MIAVELRSRSWAAPGILAAFLLAGCMLVGSGCSAGPNPSEEGSEKPAAEMEVSDTVASASQEVQESSSADSAGNAVDLEDRDADFAVDPNRKTDWNYEGNGRNVVYLTIDDGPSELTQQVLDILDRYNCKATFFVVGSDPSQYHMIKEAYDRGHTIGLHTFSHDYAQIYSSVDAYYADLDQIGQVVKDQIGYVPCFIRFPGGSSNGISANYCPGIMTVLANDVQTRGYQYYDWNMSVGDGAVHTADEIVHFATVGTEADNVVLLCHDSSTKQSTVDALPRFIEYWQSYGYSFEAIDRTTFVPHHGVGN